VTSHKREECDMVVDTISELFDNTDASSEDFDTTVGIQNTHKSTGGGTNIKLLDENGNEKNHVEYLRVPDMGSVECYKLDDGTWAITRRDKLPHNKGIQ
jgi:hypothetical protein